MQAQRVAQARGWSVLKQVQAVPGGFPLPPQEEIDPPASPSRHLPTQPATNQNIPFLIIHLRCYMHAMPKEFGGGELVWTRLPCRENNGQAPLKIARMMHGSSAQGMMTWGATGSLAWCATHDGPGLKQEICRQIYHFSSSKVDDVWWQVEGDI